MILLEQTQSAISELSGNRQHDSGTHVNHNPKVNLPGINLGEIPLDPTRHKLSDENMFSIAKIATGIPHVKQVIPRRALNIQIVEDLSPSNDDERLVQVKHGLVSALFESLIDSKPGMKDRVRHFVISDSETEESDNLGYGTELIDSNEGQESVTDAVSEICRNGLTLVISDFKRLRLDNHNDKFDSTVGIITKHPAEVRIPAGSAIVATTKGSEPVDTNNPRQLTRFNKSLDIQNAAIEARLKAAGLVLATVIAMPKNEFGFNIEETDSAIASAIEQLDT